MVESTLLQLPIDENEWSDIRRRQLFFVDKTAGLSELVNYAHAVFLSRPHGMGKTWLCSQLYELFSKGPTACAGLNVARTWPERERYLVINLSFNAVPANYQTMEQSLKDALAVAYGIAGFFEVYDWAQEPLSLNQFLTKLTTISRQQRLVFLLDDWETVIDTNIKGTLAMTRLVVPGMLERGRGHIINIGSIAGDGAYPGGSVYCATKAAVKALTDGLRIDLVDTPLRVTNIKPGQVETNFSMVRFHGDKDRADKVYEGYKPLEAADIAETVWFAASLPEHVQIAEMLVLPTCQATSGIIHKNL